MSTMRFIVALSLLVLTGCAGKPDPWGRRLTEDERVAWGSSCGSQYSKHTGGSRVTDYVYRPLGDEKGIEPECSLAWDLKHDRLFQIGVSVGFGGIQATPPTADQIEPYIQMVEQLLPPAEQRIARQVASGPRQFVKTKNFEISGGHGEGPYLQSSWRLDVALRWER